jgi:predicted Fe-Mo cluster-binding NifX family protein
MKRTVAITCQNRKEVSGHAGKCHNFFIYTIDDTKILSKELLELRKEEVLHEAFHNPEMAGQPHPIFDVDIFLVGGIGIGAINKLKTHNVDTYIIRETNPDTAVESFLAGTLEVLDLENHEEGGACNCGDEGHHHHHH